MIKQRPLILSCLSRSSIEACWPKPSYTLTTYPCAQARAAMSYRYYQPQRRAHGNYYGLVYPQHEQQLQMHYYAYPHPLEAEFQRSRPAKLSSRVLNRRFKKVTIQLNENRVLLISVIVGKGNMPSLVFSQCEGSYENKTNTVSIPEPLVVQFIQQLHKLSKWRPSTSGNLPTNQSLSHDDTVFRTLVACQSGPEVQPESRLYAIKIVAEARARDPLDRKELASVSIPLETSHLMKLKEALNEVIVASAESPLYHTKTLQCVDGSKFYLDMLRDDEAHYLKVSQVTRDYRSILHVPAEDLDAFKELIETSVRAMKGHLEEHKTAGGGGCGGSGASSKKRRGRQSRRRHKRSTEGKRGGAEDKPAAGGSSQTGSDCEEASKENTKPKEDARDSGFDKDDDGPRKLAEQPDKAQCQQVKEQGAGEPLSDAAAPSSAEPATAQEN